MERRVLMVFLSLWSSGLRAEHVSTAVPDDVRLVGGASHCAGKLEMKHQGEWKPVYDQYYDWNLRNAAEVCRKLDCGSVVSIQRTKDSSPTLDTMPFFVMYEPVEVIHSDESSNLEISCSDSVRLVNGTNLCSGRLEVKSNQSWSSVCEDDFDLQDAKVVCRELGCGGSANLQAMPFGAPVLTKEFHCGGRESTLLDCRSSATDTCSSGKAVGLTCSEPADVRLVGGASQCAGTLEMKKWGEWKPVDETDRSLKLAGDVCGRLDCGSVVSNRRREEISHGFMWRIESDCDESSLIKCSTKSVYSSSKLEITCSDSVRLVNGSTLCSGRLEVKSEQSWSSVCEDDFDLQDAEVVCRELGCGAPSVLQGALYGEMQALVWTEEFQCKGSESVLLDCGRSGSTKNTCSSDKAVGLTCSEPDDVRLVGGASRCAGRLEVKHQGEWGTVHNDLWSLKETSVICRWLDCGASVSAVRREDSSGRPVWLINPLCVQSKSTLRECVTSKSSPSDSCLEITCSESVRLVNESGPCSGRLEVKSNQSWSSVCEDDFDLQDAEVVCRELGCGAPSVLQGALYGEVEALVRTEEFKCEGNESALLDCGVSGSARKTCSPRQAVGLTCSEPDDARLVGEPSRCAGTLEMKHQGEWRPVTHWYSKWDQKSAAAVCARLVCGSAVSTNIIEDSSYRLVWWIDSSCVQSTSSLRECLLETDVNECYTGLRVICSDFLAKPIISLSPSIDGVSEAKQQGPQFLRGSNFTIRCSVEPQYQGGMFQLIFTTSAAAQNYTLPAVNHSAHFLFSAADHTHQGDYRCVYHVYVFSQNFSSESQRLCLYVAASLTDLIIRLFVLLLAMMSFIAGICLYFKAKRGQDARRTLGSVGGCDGWGVDEEAVGGWKK
ncbi:scavenger receptor cysteine-rich type 1 protein M130-like [Thunnus thynnus]|uniref:scavenger receptor cysteine-rich type 1 protein M130-like n=1 Tax=Thunnus thynnus TaxID=8237 RepID=UPI0035284EE8